MSHKTVYMGIPASKLNGKFDKKTIASVVQSIMGKYVEETAEENNIRCDWYEIGGRWEGSVGAIKGAKNILKTEDGLFGYEFFEGYDVIVNNGKKGPYLVDEIEYIPVNGGPKKSIAWDAIGKLDEFKDYKLFELIINRDPRVGTDLPENFELKDGDLYANLDEGTVLILKKGESFSEYAERRGIEFQRVMLTPDAYIDTNGVWHDDNDAWNAFSAKLFSSFDALPKDMPEKMPDDMFEDIIKGMPENPEEAAQQAYRESFEKFMDEELKDDDYFVVLDCHCFP